MCLFAGRRESREDDAVDLSGITSYRVSQILRLLCR